MSFQTWQKATQKERLNEVIDYFGSLACLADSLGLGYEAVRVWRVRGRISAQGAAKLEKLSKGKFARSYMLPTAKEYFESEEHKAGINGED